MVIQLLALTVKAWICPETVTLAPGAGVKVSGAPAVPELAGVTFSTYVPEATWTVVPAVATAAALPIVQNGIVWVPAPVLLQRESFWSTYSVVAACAAG